MRITISEVNNKANKIEMCWLPSEIKDEGENILFTTYKFIDRGEVVRTAGNEPRTVSWDSMFPGEARSGMTALASEWVDPAEYDGTFKRWKQKRKLLNLTIEGSNIENFKCYIKEYNSTYSGGFGDMYYSVSFIAYEMVTVSATKKTSSKNPSKDNPKRPTATTTTYTIKKGDTLWGISAKFLGKGTRWKEIYNLNKSAIESAAKKRGFSSSNNGNRIWPGTKLKLPKK